MAFHKHIFAHKLMVMYVVILVVLCACSIYSTYSVVDSYLNDNLLTTVETQTVRNILPFMQFITIQYAIYKKSVFPETWALNQTELEDLLPLNPGNRAMGRVAKRKNEKSFYDYDDVQHHSRGKRNLSLESIIDVALMTEIIAKMDHQFVMLVDKESKHQFIDKAAKNYNDPLIFLNSTGGLSDIFSSSENQSLLEQEIFSAVDSFLTGDYGDGLVDETLQRISSRAASIPTTFYADWLAYNSVVMTVPLDYFSNLTSQAFDFQLLQMRQGSALMPQIWYSRIVMGEYPPSAQEYTKEDLNEFAAIGENKTAEIKLFVKNMGIHDTTAVRSGQNCSICENLTSVNHCVLQCRHNWIVDNCGCVMFTYRRFYKNDPKGRGRLPRCTRELYAKCYHSGKYKLSPCDYDICVPCVGVENNFDFKKPTGPSAADQQMSDYKLQFRIVCDQNTFITFRAQWKNSLMEMLGQVGGNLGLYMGFSFYGIWQVFVFIHRSLSKWRKDKKRKRVTVHISSWLQVAKMTNAWSSPMGECKNCDQTNVRVDEAEEKIRKLEAEIRRVATSIGGKTVDLNGVEQLTIENVDTPAAPT